MVGDHVPKSSVETRHGLYQLLQQGVLTDIVLSASNKKFAAHRIILATNSEYFRALFTTQLGKQCDTCLPEISGDVMGTLLDFMYLRTLDLTNENVGDVFIAADYLAIDGAMELCSSYMAKKLDPSNCINIFLFARMYSMQQLKRRAWAYILKNFASVFERKEDFLELELDDVLNLLRSDRLNVSSEGKTWEAVLAWMEYKEDRQMHLVELIRSVRLGLMAPEYFLEMVRDHPLVSASEECKPTIIETLRLLFELDVVVQDMSEGLTLELVRPRLPQEILFAIGGWSGGSPTNCVEAYDSRADRWTTVTETDPMGPRAYHGTAVVDDEIYVIGGYNGFDYYNSCRCFNVYQRTWREVAPMNKSRCYVSVAVCGAYIYAMGGYNGQRRQNTAERYDVRTNQWTMIADMHCARSDASSACLQDKIYIVGGFNGHECLSSVEVYDPEVNEWRLIQSMSCRRSGVSCTVFQNNIYVLGGFNGLSRMASGEKYDPRDRQWKVIPDMLHARSNFAVAVVDGLLMAVGGFNGVATTSDVESYNPLSKEWSAVRSLSICRSALSACVVSDIPNIADYAFQARDRILVQEQQQQEQQQALNEQAEAGNQLIAVNQARIVPRNHLQRLRRHGAS